MSLRCYSQDSYSITLSRRLEEIRKSDYFDNSVVVLDKETGYGSNFPYWTATAEFYADDIVIFEGGMEYRALVDSRGKNPCTSPKEWQRISRVRPYLFLRDTAKVNDLKELLFSDHPYIRIYALAALAYRKSENLFQVVLDNLNDTTRIEHITSDVGYTVFPADLMLWHTVNTLNIEQRNIIAKLLLTKYTHLNTLEEVLLYHKPIPEDYQYVREIATKGICGKFGLIALSKYQKSEDVELIRNGFAMNDYYAGYKVFFIAIENLPDKSFKNNLIEYRSEIKKGHDVTGYEYYFNSLAIFKDLDCLRILEEFVDAEGDKKRLLKLSYYRDENLSAIYQALKKYYIPMYDSLIKKIELQVSDKAILQRYNHRLELSPWNY